MRRVSAYMIYFCITCTALFLSSCRDPKVAGEVGKVVVGKLAEGAASAAITNFFTQSKSDAKQTEQDLSSLKSNQSLAAEAKIAEIKEVINLADQTEIQALRDLNADLLDRAYVGKALQLRQNLVNDLKNQKTYQIGTLHSQQFHDFKINSEGSIAKVELTEKWSSELYSSDTNTLLGKFLPHVVPQVVYLQKDSSDWRISAVTFQGDPPEFVPAQQSPQPSQSNSTSSSWGVVCLVNNTEDKVVYAYRWGDEDWKKYSLEAGSSHWYSWNHSSGSDAFPKFSVRFDNNLSSDSNFKEYELEKNNASEQSCEKAKNYRFKYTDRSQSFIDLYGDD